jgi:uncharacterized membrane protein (DUF106 family)
MALVNAGLVSLFDLLLAPFRSLPALAGLAVVSLATAIVMLVVFRRTSNQAKLAAVKRSIHAGLFEIRLFNDDLRAVLRAQMEILRHNATYLRLSMVPMLWVIVPLVLVVAQLQFHYGYAPIRPGQQVLVKAALRDGMAVPSGSHDKGGELASLEAPAPIRVETPAVYLPAAREIVWRIAPEADGDYELRVHVDGETVTKTLVVADGVARRSPIRPAASFTDQLLYPSEPPLPPGSALSSLTVAYQDGNVDVFGWQVHWMIVYFALSIGFAFALRKPFGVVL